MACTDATAPQRAAQKVPQGAVATPPGLPSRIAFYTARDGNFEIYTMDEDGTGLTRVTTDPAFDALATAARWRST
jgi:hypothetical protein